jgi:hypothetical protein
MCVRRFRICCPIWVKFGMTAQHTMQLRISAFREYRRMESLNFIKRVNGMTVTLYRAAVSHSERKESLGQVYVLCHSTPFVP